MAETYGTIGILPLKEWDATTQYDLLNLVSYNGSSYVAHKKPPVGTFPTDTAYWQVSAQGSNKATASALGVVKPDGKTITVDGDGAIAAKTATQDTTGIVKGSTGIKVGTDGSIDVDTAFTEATELANIIAGEAIAQVLGKVSKAIATTMNLDQNALLKNMLTGIDVNDANKVPNAAFIHTLVERIGMGADLGYGFANLTAGLNSVKKGLDDANSNLNIKSFNSLSQIGITPGTETSLAQIANAMPKNSTLSFDIANAKNTLYPKNWGEATFERIGTRTRIIFTTQNVSSATKQVYFYTNYVVGNTEAGWFIQTMSAVQ